MYAQPNPYAAMITPATAGPTEHRENCAPSERSAFAAGHLVRRDHPLDQALDRRALQAVEAAPSAATTYSSQSAGAGSSALTSSMPQVASCANSPTMTSFRRSK